MPEEPSQTPPAEEVKPKRGNPVYTGMFKHVDAKAGYAIWLPTGWHKTEMKKGHRGVIYSPYPNDIVTCFTAEKHRLKFVVTEKDLPILREGFEQGLQSLPGVEIESQNYEATGKVAILEARLTFLEDGIRRKRWVRNLYFGNGQLVFIAQGANEEEFEYWLPMFYNTMMTYEIR